MKLYATSELRITFLSISSPEENVTQKRWSAVDAYIADTLVGPDEALAAALEESDRAGLPAISVSAAQGRLLEALARAVDARAILEVGSLGGYSSIWLARGLAPGGRLVTLEINPKYADVARKNLARAGFADRAEVRVGSALDELPKLKGPFDLVFIDADKPSNADYFAWALKLARRGSLIVVDNIARDGEVIDAKSRDPAVKGVRRLFDLIAAEPRVVATAVQTVGEKGYDGFALAVVIDA
jgi:predicted O-methyltransferase YrrM